MIESAVLEPPPKTASLPDHLSFSSIRLFQNCSRRWAYRYYEQVPEESKASSLLFGSAFHESVEKLHQCFLENSKIPSVDDLLTVYDETWTRESQIAPIQFCKEEDEASLRKLAERMLAAYVEYATLEATLPDPSQIIAIEHKNRHRLLADVPPIESRIDLLELQGTNLVVSDLKTARSRWNDAKVQESLGQLVLYATGLMPLMRELGANRIVTKFIVVTKAKNPVVQALTAQPSNDDLTRLKQTVTATWDAIKKEAFVRSEGWQCSQCPYRRRCLGR